MAEPLSMTSLASLVSLLLALPLSGNDGPFPVPRIEFDRAESTRGIAAYDAQRNRITLPSRCAMDPDERCRAMLVHELAHWLLVQHKVYPDPTNPMDAFNAEMAARYAEECVLLRWREAAEYRRLRSAIRQGWVPPQLSETEPCL